MKTLNLIGALALIAAGPALHAASRSDVRSKVDAVAAKAGVNLASPAPVLPALRGLAGQAAVDSADKVLADSEQLAAAVARKKGAGCPMESDHGLNLKQAKSLLKEAVDQKYSVQARADSLLHAAGAIRHERGKGGIAGATAAFSRSVPQAGAEAEKLALAQELVKAAENLLAE